MLPAHHNFQEPSLHVLPGYRLQCRRNVDIVEADGRPSRIDHLVYVVRTILGSVDVVLYVSIAVGRRLIDARIRVRDTTVVMRVGRWATVHVAHVLTIFLLALLDRKKKRKLSLTDLL